MWIATLYVTDLYYICKLLCIYPFIVDMKEICALCGAGEDDSEDGEHWVCIAT